MADWFILRIIRSRPRLFSGLGAGLVTMFAAMPVHSWLAQAVLGWDVGSVVFLGLTAVSFFSQEERDISADAKRQQEGEWSIFALTLLGAVMSLAAIFLFSGASSHKHQRSLYLAFVVVTLALSWLTTHVTFAYRYAHEFYSRDWNDPNGKIEGGIDFPGKEAPDYFDFIYFAFVLGMTFQVSDCDITSKKLRRLATLQGLIGFLFNTIILALSVNIAAATL